MRQAKLRADFWPERVHSVTKASGQVMSLSVLTCYLERGIRVCKQKKKEGLSRSKKRGSVCSQKKRGGICLW